MRYYSSTDTPKDGASPDAAELEASQSDIKDVDPLEKDLESKNKEIIDLKVRSNPESPNVTCFRDLTCQVCRTNTSAQ